MLSRDYRDIVTGVVLTLAGLLYAAYALARYDIGSVGEMGPGMFPMGLGVLLALFGTLIFVPAFRRGGVRTKADLRPAFAVLGSVSAFALVVQPFGLVPAVCAVVLVSVLADSKLGLRSALFLALAVSLLASLIFVFGLGMMMPLFRWPL